LHPLFSHQFSTNYLHHDQLSDLLDQLLLLDIRFVVCGDFNAPSDVSGSINHKISDIFQRYGLTQHVDVATHVSGHVLDLVVTPDDSLLSQLSVQSVCFSDHCLVTCRLNIPHISPTSVLYQYRAIKQIDMAAFRRDILQSKLYEQSDMKADQYARLIDSEMMQVLDFHAPLKTKRRRSGDNNNRWLSVEARKAKRLRRRLERRYYRTGLDKDKREYRSACRTARDSIMQSRTDNIRSELNRCAGDHRATWRTANKLLHSKQSVYYDDVESAKLSTTFNTFFVDKVNRIRASISALLPSITDKQFRVREYDGDELSQFQPVTAADVCKLLSSLPAKSSPLDVLPCSLLKSCLDVFAPVIARLANLTFTEGRFPDYYKTAQVLPLLKKRGLDQSVPANYRPISNLHTISKVLERLVLKQLRPQILDSVNFSCNQSAYRTGHSSETALLETLDSVYTAADNKCATVLVGLDISAAFDTISHEILIDRLSSEFGIRSLALSWIKSFVEERSQFIKVGQSLSSTVKLTSGVPQGSVLGPILFAVYTSPVGDVISSYGVQYHQYADDTQLSSHCVQTTLRLVCRRWLPVQWP
jgi:hypothetical protein